MSENDKTNENEVKEQIKEFEETILTAIAQAEKGNEKAREKLNELKGETIILCKDETILRLAEFYNVSIDYILCRTDKPQINR